MFGVVRT